MIYYKRVQNRKSPIGAREGEEKTAQEERGGKDLYINILHLKNEILKQIGPFLVGQIAS